MRFVAATRQSIGVLALLSAMEWASQAHAQLGVGTTWLRTTNRTKASS